MGTRNRQPAHRLRAPNRGEPIRSAFLRGLADGVNDLLAGPMPPKSLRVRSTADQITEVSDPSVETELTEDGVTLLTASNPVFSTVRVFNEQDTEQWVDVQRVDQVDLTLPDGTVWRLVISPIW